MPEYFPRPLGSPRQGGPVRAGLLGRGISGSLSPLLHRRAAALAGLALDFTLVDLETEGELGPALARLRGESWRGLSVTRPWKTALAPHLLGMSPEAISIGSVNLLLRSEQGWIGDNSDAEGFLRPLARRRLAFARALVVGAGGAARAVLHALASMPFVQAVAVRARRPETAARLVEEFATGRGEWTALAWEDPLPWVPELLVNCTPLGGEGPLAEQLPCPAAWIQPGATCYDLVYRPRETAFLRVAAARGAGRIEGLEMLVSQARRAFEAWTGRPFAAAALWRELDLDPAGAPAKDQHQDAQTPSGKDM